MFYIVTFKLHTISEGEFSYARSPDQKLTCMISKFVAVPKAEVLTRNLGSITMVLHVLNMNLNHKQVMTLYKYFTVAPVTVQHLNQYMTRSADTIQSAAEEMRMLPNTLK